MRFVNAGFKTVLFYSPPPYSLSNENELYFSSTLQDTMGARRKDEGRGFINSAFSVANWHLSCSTWRKYNTMYCSTDENLMSGWSCGGKKWLQSSTPGDATREWIEWMSMQNSFNFPSPSLSNATFGSSLLNFTPKFVRVSSVISRRKPPGTSKMLFSLS